MISNIVMFRGPSRYETNRYFADKLIEAFRRKDVGVYLLDGFQGLLTKETQRKEGKRASIAFTCSIGQLLKPEDQPKLWVYETFPHLAITVDPLIGYFANLQNPYYIFTNVDRFECNYALSRGFQNVLFFPHAVERELEAPPNQPRPYDVAFIGSSYDPESLRVNWKSILNGFDARIVETGIDIALANPGLPYWTIADKIAETLDMEIDTNVKWILIKIIDRYIRGIDRLRLIRSIKDAEIHVFGGIYQDEYIKNALGWGHYLYDQPNVVLHPSIPFADALEIQKQSKIVLNSTPTYKAGSHERILTSLACGAVPITTDNLWVREAFVPEQDLFVYSCNQYDHVNDIVNGLLSNENKRRTIAGQGREKVMENHTWDNRAAQLLAQLPPILERIKAIGLP